MVRFNQLHGALGANIASLWLFLSISAYVEAEAVNRYGNLDSATFPQWLDDGERSQPAWVNNELEWFNRDIEAPRTGKTRQYDFTLSRGLASPDGYQKQVLLINGEFPGPVIEANWGDWIQVTVHNNITGPDEGTALHWHGLFLRETPWMDGVPSVSQCPIAPRESYTYRFRADRFGSSWYHSHYSAQYSGGLLGPMIIHGPNHVKYDIDMGPIFITDWYHQEYFQIIRNIMGTNESLWRLSSQNNLINGRGTFNCSNAIDDAPCHSNAKNAQFRFKSGKTHRLRLINAGSQGFEYFSIDGHTMTVIANDFVPIKPYNTTVVTLGIGQRADVLVHGTGQPGDSFWMRANNSIICARTTRAEALAEIRYEEADLNKPPTSLAQPFVDPGTCMDDPLETTVPHYPLRGIDTPDTEQVYDISRRVNETGNQEWVVNNSAFRGNYNHPLMRLVHQGNLSYPDDPQWNVYNFGSNRTVRMIINSRTAGVSHPMHLHGHDFFVVSEGRGQWDGEHYVRPENPMRRDTVMLPRDGYVVIDVKMDNPGVWPIHCHIAWHVSQGLYWNIFDNPQNFRHKELPNAIAGTCEAWDKWSETNIVDQIDSGLRMMEKERDVNLDETVPPVSLSSK